MKKALGDTKKRMRIFLCGMQNADSFPIKSNFHMSDYTTRISLLMIIISNQINSRNIYSRNIINFC